MACIWHFHLGFHSRPSLNDINDFLCVTFDPSSPMSPLFCDKYTLLLLTPSPIEHQFLEISYFKYIPTYNRCFINIDKGKSPVAPFHGITLPYSYFWRNLNFCANLKISLFQNVFLVPSFRPKNQRNFFKNFCPRL